MKLYKYSGTIEEFAVERGRISYIKLFDVTDFDKAPTRLEVFGALGKYIEAIEGTDEALRDWGGNIEPLSDWVLVRVYNGDLRR